MASRSRTYRLVSGNGGNQHSRRTIQLSQVGISLSGPSRDPRNWGRLGHPSNAWSWPCYYSGRTVASAAPPMACLRWLGAASEAGRHHCLCAIEPSARPARPDRRRRGRPRTGSPQAPSSSSWPSRDSSTANGRVPSNSCDALHVRLKCAQLRDARAAGQTYQVALPHPTPDRPLSEQGSRP